MAKQVIVAKCLENGQKWVFNDLEEASREIGVSPAAISMASIGMRDCAGWSVRRVDRIFAVRSKGRHEWLVAVMNNRNNGYLEFENPMRKIGLREVDQVRDVTLGWYFQE